MQAIIYFAAFIYLVTMLLLAAYGISNLVSTILYLRIRRQVRDEMPAPAPAVWPPVTVQLPIYNEKYTVQRLLRSVAALDYPVDQLQIQVLDDSTDDTAVLVSRVVDEIRLKGVHINLVRRAKRTGYKAGALAEAMPAATGEFIAIFDADFVPPADWLKHTVPQFDRDPRLGCLQTRWGHTNREFNSLTRAEAMAIDGHFVVEQTARSRDGLFLNFNGTAGIWRRTCIEQAGGWHSDTLTEDLDLSYRAQLRGWHIGYLPDVVVPAELPSQVEAFKKQQFRWAKGSFQVVRKVLPDLLKRKDLPWHVRLLAFLHLTGYAVHPLMLMLLLLTLPVGTFAPITFKIFPIAGLAGFGPPLLYLVSGARQTPSLWDRIKLIPLLTMTGFGISLSTSIAVLQGLTGTGSRTFVRTPKLNEGNGHAPRKKIDRAYVQPIDKLVWIELALGLYALYAGITLSPYDGWGILPWMMVYVLGFFYIAGLNLKQHVAVWTSGIAKSFVS